MERKMDGLVGLRRDRRRLLPAVAAATGLLVALGGCSSTPTAKSIAKDESAAAEVRADAARARKDREQKEAERYVAQVPDWYLSPPKSDDDALYAVGMADSSKLDLAVKRAMLTAEFGLAKQYKSAVSGNERQYQRDSGKSGLTERYTLLVDSVVDRVPLSGYKIVRREVRPIDGVFHSWVLLRLTYDDLNKAIEAARTSERDASIDEQFAELERRLDKYREARQAEAASKLIAAKTAGGQEQSRPATQSGAEQ